MSKGTAGMVRVELHMHTRASKDSLVPVEKLLSHCRKKGINRIAITDHNVIQGALKAKLLDPDRVIVGEEIATTKGELLGYFMSEWVPPNLEPEDAIQRLQDQDVVISVAHPFDTTRNHHWSEEDLAAITPHLDAIETFNARCFNDAPNRQAAAFAKKHNLLETVGSDAHTIWEVGRATLLMADFQDAETFKTALKGAVKDTTFSPPFVHLFSRFAVSMKRLK
jgi:predicted metal-dependent phosphoesterase TrpH